MHRPYQSLEIIPHFYDNCHNQNSLKSVKPLQSNSVSNISSNQNDTIFYITLILPYNIQYSNNVLGLMRKIRKDKKYRLLPTLTDVGYRLSDVKCSFLPVTPATSI
jgi:hypothetical protein